VCVCLCVFVHVRACVAPAPPVTSFIPMLAPDTHFWQKDHHKQTTAHTHTHTHVCTQTRTHARTHARAHARTCEGEACGPHITALRALGPFLPLCSRAHRTPRLGFTLPVWGWPNPHFLLLTYGPYVDRTYTVWCGTYTVWCGTDAGYMPNRKNGGLGLLRTVLANPIPVERQVGVWPNAGRTQQSSTTRAHVRAPGTRRLGKD